MKEKIFLHNIWFRIVAPIFYGIVVYLLVLLFFDSLDNLLSNFLGDELALTVIVSIVFFQVNHYNSLIFERLTDFVGKAAQRIILQTAASLVTTSVFVSLCVYLYFTYFIGYTLFTRELNVFNILFGISALFYNLIYFSTYLLYHQNESVIQSEEKEKALRLDEIRSYKNDLRPDVFFGGFESLLELVHRDKIKAEKFLNQFSSVYRYILDAKKTELVDLSAELKHFRKVLTILNNRHNNLIKLEIEDSIKIDEFKYAKIVPCTLQIILEYITLVNIISVLSPLKLKIFVKDNCIGISYQEFLKLNSHNNQQDIEQFNRKILYFTNKEILFEKTDSAKKITIPLLVEADIDELIE